MTFDVKLLILIAIAILTTVGAVTKRYKLCAFGVLLIFFTSLIALTYFIVGKTGISNTIGNVCILGVTTFIVSFLCMFVVTELLQRNRARDVAIMLNEMMKGEEMKEAIQKLLMSDTASRMLAEIIFRPILYLTIRRSILITFTVVYFYLLSISIDPKFWSAGETSLIEYIYRNPFIQIFTYIYLASVAFYFGTRFIETYSLLKGRR
ncbi:MAG: hypothetical protein DRP01_08115 [Archaeoglobales archaeon]|nr:MAG: hypothetical protein DRP01_08115 [Archaeoglobales archaeon]